VGTQLSAIQARFFSRMGIFTPGLYTEAKARASENF